jgi:hypothetical protein
MRDLAGTVRPYQTLRLWGKFSGLLQYMAIKGPTELTGIEEGVFDRPTLGATWSHLEACGRDELER